MQNSVIVSGYAVIRAEWIVGKHQATLADLSEKVDRTQWLLTSADRRSGKADANSSPVYSN